MSLDWVEALLLQRDDSWGREYWFPPLSAALAGLGAAEAAWKPQGGGNTIWQVVNHLNYYNERILRQIKGLPGEPELPNARTFGDPGDPADTDGWEATVARARQIAAELRHALEGLRTSEIQRADASLAQDLVRWVLHDVYHMGQIVLLRRQQGSWRR